MNYRRAYTQGATYFFTINLLDRSATLLTDNIKQLKHAIRITKTTYPFVIDGIVILHDHIHLMMTLPENDSDFSFRISKIKSTFSRSIFLNEQIKASRRKKRERGIWQRRFWEHMIQNKIDFEHHLNYIHYNPVKHGYVAQPSDWQYSSIHRYIKQGIISSNWTGSVEPDNIDFGE